MCPLPHYNHLPPHKWRSTPKEISRAYLGIVDPVTGGAPSSIRIVQDCERWICSLEKIIAAGGNMVEGFGRNGHRRGNQGRRGGYRDKNTQGAAKWIHRDAICLTQHMWCESVSKVDPKLDSISTLIMLPAYTTQADDYMAPLKNENTGDMTGKMTGNITRNTRGTTSGASNPSSLTMLEFSDIESENEEREMVSNKRKIVILRSETTRWMSKRRRTIMPIWMRKF
jgi:hypothetical protein